MKIKSNIRFIQNMDGSLIIPTHQELILVTNMTPKFFRVQKLYVYYENTFVDELELTIREPKLIIEPIDEEKTMKHHKVWELMKENDILYGELYRHDKWRMLYFDWDRGWTLDGFNYYY